MEPFAFCWHVLSYFVYPHPLNGKAQGSGDRHVVNILSLSGLVLDLIKSASSDRSLPCITRLILHRAAGVMRPMRPLYTNCIGPVVVCVFFLGCTFYQLSLERQMSQPDTKLVRLKPFFAIWRCCSMLRGFTCSRRFWPVSALL